MGRVARRPEPWLVLLGSISLIAWSALGLDRDGFIPPPFCSTVTAWPPPLSVSFDLALVLNSPVQLASGWALMVAAMMSPLLVAPIRHIRERSVARRRTRAVLLFAAGYGLMWMI